MLVIISDLHLSDGSSGETVHQGTLRVFRERLRALAYAASWRADGKYKPIEEFDIVLLGDILDALRSSKWFEDGPKTSAQLRPWDVDQNQLFASKIRRITEGILSHNEVFFSLLRELREATVTNLPPVGRDGRPTRSKARRTAVKRTPVRVRIHYMVGNHDWFYHLPAPAFSEIRRSIVDALGLENNPAEPFPHDPEESAARAIREIFAEHRVFARHGDIFDPVNFEGNRDRSSVGDAVAVDLVARFAFEVRRAIGDCLPVDCLAGLNEVDNVRPLHMVPVWIGGLLRRTCPDKRLRRQVQEVWNDLVDQLFRSPFVREHLSYRHPFSSTQKLKWTLTLSKRLIAPEKNWWIRWVGESIGNVKTSHLQHAIRERSFHNRSARFIVYGHSHRHEIIPLNSSLTGEGLFNQMYINCGTWRPVHELARYHCGQEVFVGYHTMTYLAFFKEGERSGRRFECWSGALSGSSWKKGLTTD
jgi:UDP-2,3-diacylglucosamine pyrophosphatase LpxH